MTQWLEQVMHPKESGEGWERAALVLWKVINSLPKKHFEMCYQSAEDYWFVSLAWVRGAGAEGRAGSPMLCLQSTGSPFLKVWRGIVCKFLPKPPNQAASQGLNPAQRAEHTEPGRIRPCLSLYPSPALLEQ